MYDSTCIPSHAYRPKSRFLAKSRQHIWKHSDDIWLRFFATHKTASEIGAIFGRSRNSILGRAYRLGISIEGGKLKSPAKKKAVVHRTPSMPRFSFLEKNDEKDKSVFG
jgi:hypothetical protein